MVNGVDCGQVGMKMGRRVLKVGFSSDEVRSEKEWNKSGKVRFEKCYDNDGNECKCSRIGYCE